MSVDLPAPFAPTSAWTSPARSSNETPLRACTPAKDLPMDASFRMVLNSVGAFRPSPPALADMARLPSIVGRDCYRQPAVGHQELTRGVVQEAARKSAHPGAAKRGSPCRTVRAALKTLLV